MVQSQSLDFWVHLPRRRGTGEESGVAVLPEKCPEVGYSLLCNAGLLCQNARHLSEREKQKGLLGVCEESRLPTMYQPTQIAMSLSHVYLYFSYGASGVCERL